MGVFGEERIEGGDETEVEEKRGKEGWKEEADVLNFLKGGGKREKYREGWNILSVLASRLADST